MGTVATDIDCDPGRICVRFDYAKADVERMQQVSGRSYVKTPDKHWHVPLDLETCRKLRKLYGERLIIGPVLFSWARNARTLETQLGTLATANTGTLSRLPAVLPTLADAIFLGPQGLIMTEEEKAAFRAKGEGSFQCADVRFMVDSPCPLNANQQGLGKTPEWIAALFEGGDEVGHHLVVTPSASIDGTWEPELEKWTADYTGTIGIFACTGTRIQRQATLDAWWDSDADVNIVIVNPGMIQWSKDPTNQGNIIIEAKGKKKELTACRCDKRKKPHEHYVESYPELFQWKWDTVTNDECHKGAIRNHRSLTAKSMTALKADRRIALSGTPSKKKGADIWGILHWLRPEVFTSFWRVAEDYFVVTDNGYGKRVGGLRSDMEEEFYRMLIPYVLRRTKAECLPWLPPKLHVEVLCTMTGAQLKQYQEMEKDGAAKVGDANVSTTSILAEFTRLRQFAFGYWEAGPTGKLIPTDNSCKLEAMLQKMDEADVFEDPSVKQLVFSQYKEVIYLVAEALRARGVKVEVLSGDQNKQGQRRQIKEAFQDGDTQVLCIVTTAGGVSLTLDAADTVHMVDDMWSPDEGEQAEDRAHRASRVHNVTIYHYRTKDSIDQYVQETSDEKADEHKRILDVRRKLVRKWFHEDGEAPIKKWR